MKVTVINEDGYKNALFGIGLSYGLTSGFDIDPLNEDSLSKEGYEMLYDKLYHIACKLVHKGNAENKFLRQISVTLDINMPLYW